MRTSRRAPHSAPSNDPSRIYGGEKMSRWRQAHQPDGFMIDRSALGHGIVSAEYCIEYRGMTPTRSIDILTIMIPTPVVQSCYEHS